MERHLLLSSLYTIQKARKRKPVKKNTVSNGASGSTNATRHRTWSPKDKYLLYKEGIMVERSELARMHAAGTLVHEHLYYFCHTDPKIERADRIEPKWVVAFCVGPSTYVLPQQPYLIAIYKKLGRTSDKRAMEMLPDGTPYWVDAYTARVRRDKEAKRRYSQRMREEKKNKKQRDA